MSKTEETHPPVGGMISEQSRRSFGIPPCHSITESNAVLGPFSILADQSPEAIVSMRRNEISCQDRKTVHRNFVPRLLQIPIGWLPRNPASSSSPLSLSASTESQCSLQGRTPSPPRQNGSLLLFGRSTGECAPPPALLPPYSYPRRIRTRPTSAEQPSQAGDARDSGKHPQGRRLRCHLRRHRPSGRLRVDVDHAEGPAGIRSIGRSVHG